MHSRFTIIPVSIGSTGQLILLKLKVSNDAVRLKQYLDMFSAGSRPTFDQIKIWLVSQKIEHRIEEMAEPIVFLPEKR